MIGLAWIKKSRVLASTMQINLKNENENENIIATFILQPHIHV